MTLNLGLANLVGLLIIIAGIVGFVIAGRRNVSRNSSTRKGD